MAENSKWSPERELDWGPHPVGYSCFITMFGVQLKSTALEVRYGLWMFMVMK
jgi:hypothetical protein